MKHVVNVQKKAPDEDPESLRARVAGRENITLRDTYYLIDSSNSPSKRLTMGYTTIYPTGTTTGHTHDDRKRSISSYRGKGSW